MNMKQFLLSMVVAFIAMTPALLVAREFKWSFLGWVVGFVVYQWVQLFCKWLLPKGEKLEY